MSDDQFTPADPTERFASPGSGNRPVAWPGRNDEMDVVPDHGERTYRGTDRLVDRKVVLTGGDSGIGRAVAIAMAREGADVLLTHLPEEADHAAETARWVGQAGREAVTVAVDLREEQQCTDVVARAVDAFGRIDVLISNAAYQMSQDKGLLGITTEQFDRVMRTNVYALFWLARAAVPHMPPGSSIITTSSVQAFSPSPHLLDYATSKAAIVNFTKGLGHDLVDRGIRVNSVAPGPVWTPLIPATMGADKLESFGAQAPMGRAAQPAELAPFFVFLASQESSYMTSEVLGVTGGSPIT
ncbi:MAG: SDR family oxidoreductase [Pseudonocardia sp.]|uniref:SDR family oxidoreductase n=1 Tax=unclassified Pseudonocardia TaxID=2619320 RepID=UPI00086E3E62|nr:MULTISPECIES: SDR family oxidoreductase [unclassified Pseudonocardia]MBN9107277.1 SDR family oxidoreductase [Pseudonocardia sp.]ODU27018.1 MAG: NAD(P)-dependent oxidoreductase [Pseudonocardia sp. SCN 72-51]ODV06533.1 MAG: NAD(P)-dependent oxidoreductase [Pseudonocardia sp. SCN 73-27]RTL70425.1 MAG: SDR family oxidoreductase [Pseudonocardiaceae bacterium]